MERFRVVFRCARTREGLRARHTALSKQDIMVKSKAYQTLREHRFMSSPTSNQGPLRVVFVGARDSGGGAARITSDTFKALWNRKLDNGLSVSLRVIQAQENHPGILGGAPQLSFFEKWETLLRKRVRRLTRRRKFFSPHTIYESRAEIPTGLAQELLRKEADLFVLNWLGSRTLSIREIGKLGQRVVWQLHDMWMFSGAEHYRFDDRASAAYSRKSRPPEETGPDINRRIFRLKKKYWRHPVHVIVPSRWLANEVKKSTLTANWPVHILPYPVDTDFWRPSNPIESRRALGFHDNDLVILFGAVGGTGAFHKGGDLLLKSLEILATNESEFPLPKNRVKVAIFGESSRETNVSGFGATFLGTLSDEQLRLAFSAASVLVVPSRLENFALIGLWGQACGAPEVVFEGTGMTDIVDHGVTGFHASRNDPHDLATRIHSVLTNPETQESFSRAARARALALWQEDVVAAKYAQLLHNIAQNPQTPSDA